MNLARKLLVTIVGFFMIPLLGFTWYFYTQTVAKSIDENISFLRYRIQSFLHFEIKDRYNLLVNSDLISDPKTVASYKKEIMEELKTWESSAFIYEGEKLIFSSGDSPPPTRGSIKKQMTNPQEHSTKNAVFVGIYFSQWDWYLGIGRSYDVIVEQYSQTLWRAFAIIFGLGGIAVLGLYAYVSKGIVKPLKNIVGLTERLSHGDYRVELDGDRTDEIGTLNTKFMEMAASIESLLHEKEKWGISLEKTIAERTKELSQTNERLQNALKANYQFLAQVSHDLRTPLNAIIGYSEMILDSENRGEWEEQDIERIKASGLFLLAMVDDILAYNTIESNALKIVPKDIDAKALIEGDIANSARQLAKSRGNRFVLELDSRIDLMHTDPARFHRVVNNLLENANKFTTSGLVTLRAFPQGEKLVVQVEDTGIGISEENIGKIFEVFNRVHDTSLHDVHGTGLGLAITKKIVDLMGGEIKVTSNLGKGTVFTLEFEDCLILTSKSA